MKSAKQTFSLGRKSLQVHPACATSAETLRGDDQEWETTTHSGDEGTDSGIGLERNAFLPTRLPLLPSMDLAFALADFPRFVLSGRRAV